MKPWILEFRIADAEIRSAYSAFLLSETIDGEPL